MLSRLMVSDSFYSVNDNQEGIIRMAAEGADLLAELRFVGFLIRYQGGFLGMGIRKLLRQPAGVPPGK